MQDPLSRPGLAWVLAIFLASSLQLQPAAAQTAAEPWDGLAFAADPAAVLAAAEALPAADGADVLVLLEDGHFRFDAQGRRVYRYRLVYRILNPAGLQGWSTTAAGWSPWYQARPSLEARVIGPGGAVHRLDPATIGEFPVSEEQPEVLSDRRVLRAPLPAVAVGAVVETEAVIEDLEPSTGGGTVHPFYFGQGVPVQRTRLTVEAPESLPLSFRAWHLPALEPRQSAGDGRVHWTFESGPLEALSAAEALTPATDPTSPVIAISTAESWSGVAGRYAEIVEAQLAGAALEPIARQALGQAETRADKIARLLAWLQDEVRYTGLEFGEAAIVPRTPAQTLERKYGDCKDKAVLLTALLRAAGIPAHLALLNTGPGWDATPGLPGLGWFDHAIVYAPGAPDLWIDPTDDFARAGELPLADQDRRALIIAPGSAGLTLTPAAPSTENRTVERREIFLAPDLGGGRVVETTRVWGSIERSYRRFYAGSDPADLEKMFEGYAGGTYAAEELISWHHTDPVDLSVPFEIRIEADGATVAFIDVAGAAVAIDLAPLLDRLPAALLPAADEGTGEPRSSDLVLPEPYVAEWRYRIVPPPGYQPGTLPAAEVRQLGPATLATESAAGEDGAVELTLRFDTGKRRLVPEEVLAMRAEVRKVLDQDPVLVLFDHLGETYLATGRFREALDELRRLAALEPERALPRTRIARALLAAGLGEAARREARAAVAMAPELDLAYQTLGWVLTHDRIGRHFQGDFELEGALEAYRKAKELDPENGVTRQNLAIVLEHDAEGVRYGAGARLEEAAAEYRSLKGELGETGLEGNLLVVLLRLQHFEECKQLAHELAPSASRNAILMAAIAATESPWEAIKEASRIEDTSQQRQALINGGSMLVQLRLYPQAAELFAAGARGAPNATAALAQAETVRKTRRYEELSLPDDDPHNLVRRLLIATFQGTGTDELSTLLSRHVAEPGITGELADFTRTLRAMRPAMRQKGAPIASVLDIMLAGMEVSIDGETSSGLRLRARWNIGTNLDESPFFLVREDGRYRILASEGTSEIGGEALRRLAAGDLAAARQWLDWAHELTDEPSDDDPFADESFLRFWSSGSEAGADEIRAAAASLLAAGDDAETAIPILRQGREEATSGARRLSFDLALARAYAYLGRWQDLLPMAKSWIAQHPESVTAFAAMIGALAGTERYEDYRRTAEGRLALLPEDPHALRALADLADRDDDLERSRALLERVAASADVVAGDFNELAWNALLRGQVTEHTLDTARQAAHRSESQSVTILHTLATTYAELGKSTEAREVLLQAMTVGGYDEPRTYDWYVWGRIAESYGETETAAQAYRRVEAPENPNLLPTSTYRLAQRRLEGL